ncbi:MAG: alpha/beta fold hydrolase, partial [Acidobacteria bacterium]|nr:alpha/beta fold hydrolase [Acidobacteriota bacterium]
MRNFTIFFSIIFLFATVMQAMVAETVTFKSGGFEEINLSGDLIYNADKIDAPAVIMCHPHPEGGGSKDIPIYLAIADKLSRAGYTVLRFDFRGVGKSEGQFGEGEEGENDVRGAVSYLLSHPVLKPSKIFLFGYSYGAGTAFRVSLFDSRINGTVLIGLPTVYFTNFVEYKSINNPNVPMKIIIGAEDFLSKGMVTAMRPYIQKTFHKYTLIKIPGENHSFSKSWEGIIASTLEFLEKYS